MFTSKRYFVQVSSNPPVKVNTSGCKDITDFIEACHLKYSIALAGHDTQEIVLTLHDGVLLDKDSPFPPENTSDTPIILSLSNRIGTISSNSFSSFAQKAPNAKRKPRWIKINEILDKNKKNLTATNSAAYCYVLWNQVKGVFLTTPYKQNLRTFPQAQLNLLTQNLNNAAICFGTLSTGTDTQRIHLIAPILISVCILFNGEAKIEVEENLDGMFIHAHGHFDFVLRRGDKRVCIVQAKKGDFLQGMAQNLLGCEIAAELDDSSCVYGIVTDYTQWIFMRNTEDNIEIEEMFVALENGVPDQKSLGLICSKIYRMLSDDEDE